MFPDPRKMRFPNVVRLVGRPKLGDVMVFRPNLLVKHHIPKICRATGPATGPTKKVSTPHVPLNLMCMMHVLIVY